MLKILVFRDEIAHENVDNRCFYNFIVYIELFTLLISMKNQILNTHCQETFEEEFKRLRKENAKLKSLTETDKAPHIPPAELDAQTRLLGL